MRFASVSVRNATRTHGFVTSCSVVFETSCVPKLVTSSSSEAVFSPFRKAGDGVWKVCAVIVVSSPQMRKNPALLRFAGDADAVD